MPSSKKTVLKELHQANSVSELNKLAEVKAGGTSNLSVLCKSADKVFLKAQDFDMTSDEEMAYVFFMRYFNIIAQIKKSPQYKKEKLYIDKLLGDSKSMKAITRAEKLQSSLLKRYEERQKMKDDEEMAKKLIARTSKTDEENQPKETKKETKPTSMDDDLDNILDGPAISSPSDIYQKLKVNHSSILTPEGSNISNGLHDPNTLIPELSKATPFLTAEQLYSIIKRVNTSDILILDIRPQKEYAKNHIHHVSSINIPAEFLEHGVSVSNIERRLQEKTRVIWCQRGTKPYVVLLDKSSKVSDISPTSKLYQLKEAIFRYDSYCTLKNEPLFLDGGFDDWLWHYPSLATKPELPSVSSSLKLNATIDVSALDFPEIPVEKKITPVPPPVETQIKPPVDKRDIAEQNDIYPSMPNIKQRNDGDQGQDASVGSHPADPELRQAQVNGNLPSYSEDSPAVLQSNSRQKSVSGTVGGQHAREQNAGGRHSGGQHSGGQHAGGQHAGGQHAGGSHSGGQHAGGQHSGGQHDQKTTVNGSQNPNYRTVSSIQPEIPEQPTTPSSQAQFPGYPVVQKNKVHIPGQPTVPGNQPQTSGYSILQTNQAQIPVHPNISSNQSEIPGGYPVIQTSQAQIPESQSLSDRAQVPGHPKVSPNQPQVPGHPTIPSSQAQIPGHPTIPSSQAQIPGHPTIPSSQAQIPGHPTIPSSQAQIPGHPTIPSSQAQIPGHPTIPSSQAQIPGHQTIPSSQAQVPGRPPSKPLSNQGQVTGNPPTFSYGQPVVPGQHTAKPPVANQGGTTYISQSKSIQASGYKTTEGLPPGWEKCYDSSNRLFYKDHNSQTTHWTLPNSIPGGKLHRNTEKTPNIPSTPSPTPTPQQQPIPPQPLQRPPQQPILSKPQPTIQNQHTPQQQPKVANQNHSPVQPPRPTMESPATNKVKSNLRRSLSSPNLAKLEDNEPHIDRSSKPVEQVKKPSFSRNSKPVTTLKLDSLNPVRGGIGRGLTGLRNLGNTCYMNSVLQCLFSAAPLAAYFISGAFREDLNTKNPMGTRGELAEQFSTLVRVTSSGHYKSISATDFKKTIGRIKSTFSGFDQQDSQEFLTLLMDKLHEDVNKITKKPYLPAPEDDIDPKKAAEIAWSNHKKRNESIMLELFDGLFMSTVHCLTCGKESATFETFSNLTLPLPTNSSHCTLKDCLKLFTRPEKMSGDDKWFCPRCKQHREAIKQLQIWRLPPILIIHLKRFQYDGMWRQKLQTSVNFPVRDLDMSGYVTGPKSSSYNLFSISNHYGTMHGGHYTAYCVNSYDKRWYKFDDQVVTEISSANNVVTSAGYLLFYTSLQFTPPKIF